MCTDYLPLVTIRGKHEYKSPNVYFFLLQYLLHPLPSYTTTVMRSLTFAAAMALATCVFTAPTTRTTANQTSFADNPSGYMMGFKNPRIDSSAGGLAICISGTVDVTASANNVHLNTQEPANQSALTEFLVEGVQINSTIHKRLVGGPNNVSGTYGIYSQLCFPNGKINATTVQFLTHGLGIDRSYWNNAPDYSYVDYASERGYTTFLYDRLGTGLSDHPDPNQVVQAQLQVAVAHELIKLLRTGGISGHAFEHVVGAGHSFGSFLTHGLATQYPHDLDAAVLTGFSTSTTGMPAGFAAGDLTIASQAEPLRFANLSNGYVTSNSIQGTQFAFFRAPGFDPALLNLCEATKQTITIGEYLTTTSLFAIATNFTGPIDVVNGENDLLNCDGNCLLPHNLAAALKGELYPAASNGSSYYLGPGSGHFLNYHYAAPIAYEHIHDFIKQNGF
jgi:pimeloyl-ACP methyl ester carboxylesterase